jgi:hypothetical protein
MAAGPCNPKPTERAIILGEKRERERKREKERERERESNGRKEGSKEGRKQARKGRRSCRHAAGISEMGRIVQKEKEGKI